MHKSVGVQMDILVKKMDAGRPLYLSIACEELRVFGEFRHVTDKIRTMSSELAGLVETVSVDVCTLHRNISLHCHNYALHKAESESCFSQTQES